jgi:CheY-like chemotaxis protein
MNKQIVLIAEDDADDRFLLQSAFEENGFNDHLHFVENGVAVMEYLRERMVDMETGLPVFILLDLNMPKKDGREVLREIKQVSELRKIPVVVFSTTNNRQEMVRCYELGANSYITKPNSFESLIRIIGSVRHYWIEVNNTVM